MMPIRIVLAGNHIAPAMFNDLHDVVVASGLPPTADFPEGDIAIFHGATRAYGERERFKKTRCLVVCQSKQPVDRSDLSKLKSALPDVAVFGLFAPNGLTTVGSNPTELRSLLEWLSNGHVGAPPLWLREPSVADNILSLALVAALPAEKRLLVLPTLDEATWAQALAEASRLPEPAPLADLVRAFRLSESKGDEFLRELACRFSR